MKITYHIEVIDEDTGVRIWQGDFLTQETMLEKLHHADKSIRDYAQDNSIELEILNEKENGKNKSN